MMARRINDFMPNHMHLLTRAALQKAGRSPRGAKFTILGWAYLADTNDSRNTPAAPYRDLLLKDGVDAAVHDPYVADNQGFPVFRDLEDAVKGSDGIALITAHGQYEALDLRKIKKIMRGRPPILIDGRQVIPAQKAHKAGLIYMAVGRGDINGPMVSKAETAKKKGS